MVGSSAAAVIATGGSNGYKRLTAGGGGGHHHHHHHHDLALTDEEEAMGGIQLTSTKQQQQQPQWVLHVDAVEKCLVEIRSQMDELQSMHATRLGSVFGKDLASMESRIEHRTHHITGQFRSAEQSLQMIGKLTRRTGNDQDALVGSNIQRSLAQQLQELSASFRHSQRKYLSEVQAQKSGGLVPMSSSSSDMGVGAGGGPGGVGAGEFFTSQQLAVVDDMTVMIQSRDQEIAQIARSIEELGSIFKELAVLVIDQGTILDRIDYNMEAVVESTKTGIKQLEKAERHQKNARPLRCIVCLSITIFVLLLILILKHRPRRGWF
jgi:syntaxin 16